MDIVEEFTIQEITQCSCSKEYINFHRSVSSYYREEEGDKKDKKE